MEINFKWKNEWLWQFPILAATLIGAFIAIDTSFEMLSPETSDDRQVLNVVQIDPIKTTIIGQNKGKLQSVWRVTTKDEQMIVRKSFDLKSAFESGETLYIVNGGNIMTNGQICLFKESEQAKCATVVR